MREEVTRSATAEVRGDVVVHTRKCVCVMLE